MQREVFRCEGIRKLNRAFERIDDHDCAVGIDRLARDYGGRQGMKLTLNGFGNRIRQVARSCQ